MKKFFASAAALVAIVGCSMSASAENIPFTVAENDNPYPVRGHIDYKSDTEAWPNLYVDFADKNMDGDQQIFNKGEYSLAITGPDNYKWQGTCGTNPGANADNSHAYASCGKQPAGTYKMDITLTLTYVDASKSPLVEKFTATYVLPEPDLTKLVYTLSTGEFTRLSSTSGDLQYTINVTGPTDNIDYWEIWASRVGDENMDITQVPVSATSGVLKLTVLPENANTAIWPKVKAVFKDGTSGPTVQTNTNVSTVAATTPVFTLYAGNPQPKTATTGTLDYAITVTENADNVDYFVITVNTDSDNDRLVAEPLETKELSGVIQLTSLNSKADTNMWVKAYAVTKDGQKTSVVQYPWVEQNYQPIVINTVESGVEDVDVETAEAVYYTLQGVRVANPAAGQIYIVVKGNKSFKALVK